MSDKSPYTLDSDVFTGKGGSAMVLDLNDVLIKFVESKLSAGLWPLYIVPWYFCTGTY